MIAWLEEAPPIVRSACVSGVLLAALCAAQRAQATHDPLLEVVSSREDAVSGDSALVELDSPFSNAEVFANGLNVTSSFHHSQRRGKMLSVMSGLRIGKNALEVRVGGVTKSRLEIVSHPLSGPVFSGLQQRPFTCETEANGLGAALDSNCSAHTVVQYYYKSAQEQEPSVRRLDRYQASKDLKSADAMPGFKRYDPTGPRPPDVARIVNRHGELVDYIVRREIGVINRAVYQILFLHQPASPLPDPWTPFSSDWNGRLVYLFGGGCGPGHHQGVLPALEMQQQEPVLSLGYAIASSSLNVLANNCNEKLSAETASMVREHFIERYGQPIFTIGVGDSSGAVSAYLTAQNYPGILDAIIAYRSAPDHITTVIPVFSDCALLSNALLSSAWSWTEMQRTAVSGFATWQTCSAAASLHAQLGWLDPKNCHSSVPTELIYDRKSNPKGIRCTYYDNAIDTFGRDPATGFARRTLDNVGVQYGLMAFNAGTIDAERFLELNARIGGFDPDGRSIPRRMTADATAVRIARSRGAMLIGRNLDKIPIIDWNVYTDDLGDIHTLDRAFLTRHRLIAANGEGRNQAIIVTPRPIYGEAAGYGSRSIPDVGLDMFLPRMDRWLMSIAADARSSPKVEKIIRNKPPDLEDSCLSVGGQKTFEPATPQGNGKCNALYPPHGNPRVAAGAPPAGDILKCSLKPVDPADYASVLTSSQIERLRAIFPEGVCDYTKPGPGHEDEAFTWRAQIEPRVSSH